MRVVINDVLYISETLHGNVYRALESFCETDCIRFAHGFLLVLDFKDRVR